MRAMVTPIRKWHLYGNYSIKVQETKIWLSEKKENMQCNRRDPSQCARTKLERLCVTELRKAEKKITWILLCGYCFKNI